MVAAPRAAAGPDPLVLPAVPASVRVARRWATARVAESGHDELVDVAALLVTELVTNAVLHTGTPVRLSVVPEPGGVRVEVADDSPTPPRRRNHSASATTGRGLALVEDLSAEWGWRPHEAGKAVWFRLLAAGHEHR